MDKKEVIINNFKAFIVRVLKENIFKNINFKSCLVEIMSYNKTTFMDIFYDDIINLVLLIGDIDFLTLEKYFYKRFNLKLTKGNVLDNIGVGIFFCKPIDRLFWWEQTKEGFRYWSKKNAEYKEMIERFCLYGEGYL